jgi:1-deoxy-D-xylulose-5-phosphate synthase
VENFKDTGKRKIAFFGLGPMFTMAQQAAEELGKDFDCALINPRFTKPIDEATTEYFSKTADQIVTIEDHVLPGGYGSVVSELLVEKGISTPLLRIGWPDQFIEHASSVSELREKYGLTPKAIAAQIKSASSTKASSKAKAVA